MIVKPPIGPALASSPLTKLSSIPNPSIPNSAPTRRGTFVLLEGVDRCGKTTQCHLLLKHLLSLSIATVAMRFPDRTTSIGSLIDGYLKSARNVDDRAIHLLFSANRWEAVEKLEGALAAGESVVCDRYAYSGVAFSSAKEVEGVDLEWCKGCDVGLPAPDVVLFLDLNQEEAQKRGGYGGERYEKRELQTRVRQKFSELQACDEKDGRVPWHIIDASQSIEKVACDINDAVSGAMKRVAEGAPLRKMWCEGEYILPSSRAEK